MEAREFVKAYPSHLSPRQIHSGPHSALIRNAQVWSHRFGEFLHPLLAGQTTVLPGTVDSEFDTYMDWIQQDFQGQDVALVTQPDGPRALNEINFHAMNQFMLNLWAPILMGRWLSKNDRLSNIAYSQRWVAYTGTIYYLTRQQYAHEHGEAALFAPEFSEIAGTITGLLQEYDVAIILLDIIRRHPNLTLIPAPMQFERTVKRTNVDFLVIDVASNRAVGIQVKTKVRQSDIDTTDKDRVVLIDGNIDLQNVKAVRTRRHKSDEQVVPWPGLVSAHYIQSLKAKGVGPERMSLDELGRQQRLKMAFGAHIRDIKVDRRDIVHRLNDRILAKL